MFGKRGFLKSRISIKEYEVSLVGVVKRVAGLSVWHLAIVISRVPGGRVVALP